MTSTEEIADFSRAVSYYNLPEDVVDELKKRLLDTIGIGINAMSEDTVDKIYKTIDKNGSSESTLWGSQKKCTTSEAAMHNTVLTRYLDYMDSFLAPGETPHPSDNIASIIAVAEKEDLTGTELIECIGVAYEVQGELAWNAPVRNKGWDHVTHTIISQTAAAGRAKDLSKEELQNAIGIAGTAHNPLRVTRTGGINEWKGIAAGNSARNAVYSVELASNGIEGPKNLFEGHKGWEHILSGKFEINLSDECTRVHDTMTKRFVAETYAQSAVEGVIELSEEHNIDHREVNRIELNTYEGAKLIIGGGEGDRHEVTTKAEADHSLPYMLAVSLIDKEMMNRQYVEKRINSDDVQNLLQKVEVYEDDDLTERFESGDEMPAHVVIETDNNKYNIRKERFNGHPTDPMDWSEIEEKFRQTAGTKYDDERVEDIIHLVKNMEDHQTTELVELLD